MHEHISSDRLTSHHRTREDYTKSPVNTLQFATEINATPKVHIAFEIERYPLIENTQTGKYSTFSVGLEHFKKKHHTIRLLSARLFVIIH